jgi:hypothetical protein
MFVCFLLKNIHNTFYGCQTALHFLIQPPTFEEAHPIPNAIIFSDNYVGGDLYDIDISDDDDDVMDEE